MPVGADRPIAVDLRIVTATHKQLDAEVAAGRFRADLRTRLLGAGLELAALARRREDLCAIIGALLARLAPGRAVTFAADAMIALYTYAWPLNIQPPEIGRRARAILNAAMERHRGNLAGGARELGKDRTQIQRWMKRLGLSRDGDGA